MGDGVRGFCLPCLCHSLQRLSERGKGKERKGKGREREENGKEEKSKPFRKACDRRIRR